MSIENKTSDESWQNKLVNIQRKINANNYKIRDLFERLQSSFCESGLIVSSSDNSYNFLNISAPALASDKIATLTSRVQGENQNQLNNVKEMKNLVLEVGREDQGNGHGDKNGKFVEESCKTMLIVRDDSDVVIDDENQCDKSNDKENSSTVDDNNLTVQDKEQNQENEQIRIHLLNLKQPASKDSKWTLKHRGPSVELAEVIPGTGVYVNAEELKEAKEKSKSYRSLGRRLLEMIFRESALLQCSLTGTRARAFRNKAQRPGLDKHARSVLFLFVKDFSKEKGWSDYDKVKLTSSIQCKLNEIKVKHDNDNKHVKKKLKK